VFKLAGVLRYEWAFGVVDPNVLPVVANVSPTVPNSGHVGGSAESMRGRNRVLKHSCEHLHSTKANPPITHEVEPLDFWTVS